MNALEEIINYFVRTGTSLLACVLRWPLNFPLTERERSAFSHNIARSIFGAEEIAPHQPHGVSRGFCTSRYKNRG